jgi:uncharacterized protein
VRVPMLFLHGTRDDFATAALLEPLLARLGAHATLESVPDADHSFHVPARTGRRDQEILAGLLTTVAAWCAAVAGRDRR